MIVRELSPSLPITQRSELSALSGLLFNPHLRDILSPLMKLIEQTSHLIFLRALLLISLVAGLCAPVEGNLSRQPEASELNSADHSQLDEIPALNNSFVARLEGRASERGESKRHRAIASALKRPLQPYNIRCRRPQITHPQSYYPWSYILQIADRAPPRSA